MNIVGSVEPLSLRVQSINLDSISESRELPMERIAAPTLIISARDDLFNTLPAAELAARKIRDARLIVYESGGHLLVGRTEQVRAAVRMFLANAGLIPPSNAAPAVCRAGPSRPKCFREKGRKRKGNRSKFGASRKSLALPPIPWPRGRKADRR